MTQVLGHCVRLCSLMIFIEGLEDEFSLSESMQKVLLVLSCTQKLTGTLTHIKMYPMYQYPSTAKMLCCARA